MSRKGGALTRNGQRRARLAVIKALSAQSWPEGLRGWAAAPYLIFCLALALRLWGLSFGLPHYFAADEIYKREDALRLAETHFTHRNSQPSFLYNTVYLVFSIGRLLNPDLTAVQYHYLGRFWMALLGALTVLVLYRLGSVWDRRVGLLAALFLAILPLHTACSRYMKEDIPLTLMATITILLVVLYLQQPSRPALSLTALVAGISFSTKYSGLLLAVPLLLALGVSAWRARREVRAILLDVGLTVIAFGVGFFLVSPIYLWHPDSLVSGVLGQWKYSATGHHDGIIHNPWSDWWLYYIRTGLIPGMTWPLFLVSVVGLVLLPRSRDGWIITATAAWLYLVFEHGSAKPYPFSVRYLLPIAPLLCLSAAYAVMVLAGALRRRLPAPTVYGVCFVIAIAPPLVKSALIADEAVHDTRLAAAAWMEQAIPRGARLVISEPMMYLPPSRYWDTEWQTITPDRLAELFPIRRPDELPYFVMSSFTYQRYLDSPNAVPWKTSFYSRIIEEFRLVKEFRPRWLTYGFHSPVIRIYQPRAPTRQPSSDVPAARTPAHPGERARDGDR
jgi:hypothetical protein